MSVVKRDRQPGAAAAICVASVLMAFTPFTASAGGTIDAVEAETAPTSPNASVPGVADWLERAARSYQSDIADKLSVPRQAGDNAGEPERVPDGLWGAFQTSVRAALGYIAFWIDSAYRAAGLEPPNAAQYALIGPSVDQAAYDAKEFVEARKKAEADWKEAVERANAAAAEVAREAKRAGATGGETPAEAERKRAEARKLELEKIKQDLDRRIAEGLAKLEALDNANKARKAEETRKTLSDEAARKAEEALRETEKARAEDARKAAEAEAARKSELEQKAAEERRVAEAKAAEEKRLAEAEAQKQAEKKAQQEIEKERAEEAHKAAEKKRFAEARVTEARLVEAAAAAARKAEAERKAAAAKYQAEIKAAEEQRLAAVANAEPAPKPASDPAAVSGPPKAAEKASPLQGAARVAEVNVAESTVRPHLPRKNADFRASRNRVKAAARQSRRELAAYRKHKRNKARAHSYRTHVVRRCETLWSISRRFLKDGSRYAAIFDANRKKIRNPNRIYPGQKLRIPRSRG